MIDGNAQLPTMEAEHGKGQALVCGGRGRGQREDHGLVCVSGSVRACVRVCVRARARARVRVRGCGWCVWVVCVALPNCDWQIIRDTFTVT